nr:40S ribosomal protein SA-like [Mirounga angustirostris]
MAVTKEEFQGEWTAPAPKRTLTQPEGPDGCEGMQVSSASLPWFSAGVEGPTCPGTLDHSTPVPATEWGELKNKPSFFVVMSIPDFNE